MGHPEESASCRRRQRRTTDGGASLRAIHADARGISLLANGGGPLWAGGSALDETAEIPIRSPAPGELNMISARRISRSRSASKADIANEIARILRRCVVNAD